MRRTADLLQYVEDVKDAYVVERNFCAFQVETLFGVVVWGRPTAHEAQQIVRAREPELRNGTAPHHLVLDYRLVEVIDPDAFGCLAEWVQTNREALGKVTARAALILPKDRFAASIVAGFYTVVDAPYPSKLCTTLEEAEAWLGVPTIAPVTAAHDASAAGKPVTSALTQLLDRQPTLGMDEAGRTLGYARRTLQRRLHDEGTSFLGESRRARVRRAKYLLLSTDSKIAAIADSIGCATAQHFSELFRAETGVAPTEWRDRVRTGRGT